MHKLPPAKRAQMLAMLCEGASMMAVSRVCDVSFNAVKKLLKDAGEAAALMHDELVRGVNVRRCQADEVWSFCYAKQKNVATAKAAPEGAGDVWTWTALDRDTKLIISYFVGDRSGQSAIALMDDLRARVSNKMQLTTDGYRPYLEAVEGAFGDDIDYAQLVKLYGAAPDGPQTRYSPPACLGARKTRVTGKPDPAHVSTSHVERSNLSLRMHNRRFTRLTNAFSKRFVSHVHMVALYTVFYNFMRIHKTLRVTPAMAAGVATTVWSFGDFIARMDAVAPKPGRRGPYKKKTAA
jgi:IS1 family transposase